MKTKVNLSNIVKVESIEQTFAVAGELFNKTIQQAKEKGLCIALTGDLGSGKTAFVKGFLKSAGINPTDVISPTFVIMQDYKLKNGVVVYHFDLYRLNFPDDLESFGYNDYIGRKGSISLIEWADKFKEAIPKDAIWVNISYIDSKKRQIELRFPGSSIG